MTSLMDDGLAEDCLDDLISSLNFEQNKIINLDDINATIEDPGYILDESLATNNETKEYTSSYKRGSFTLPVTFFDVSNNVSLLQKCRPISIRVVDCKRYPWYYKEMKRKSIRNSIVYEDDDDGENDGENEACKQDSISADYDNSPKTYVSSAARTSDMPIKLSSDQRMPHLKLSEEIQKNIIADISNSNTHITPGIDKKIMGGEVTSQNYSLIEADKVLTENRFEKDCGPNDLYKTIAQTIVRSIDVRDKNLEANDVLVVQENEVFNNRVCSLNEDMRLANVEKNSDATKEARIIKSNGKRITSPILPYKIKAQKKAELREKLIMKLKKVPRDVKMSCNSNKTCKTLISTTNKVIPHYHYPQSMSACMYNYNDYYLNTDQMKSQYNVTKYSASHYVNQNGTINKYPQYELNYRGHEEPKASTDRNMNANSNMYANVMPTMHNNPLSYDTTLMSNINKLQDFVSYSNNNHSFTQPLNSWPTFDYRDNLNYHIDRCTISGYSPQTYNSWRTEHTVVGANARGTDISKDNYRVLAQYSYPGYSTSLKPSPISFYNKHITPTGTHSVVLPASAKAQDNPMLTQLLNKPRYSPESSQCLPMQQFAHTSNFSTKTLHTNSIPHNYINNVYEQPLSLYSKYSTECPSEPPSTLKRNINKRQVTDGKMAVNVTSAVTLRTADNVNIGRIHKKLNAGKVANVNSFITRSSRPTVRELDNNYAKSLGIPLTADVTKYMDRIEHESIDLTDDDVSELEKLLTAKNLRDIRKDKAVTNKYENKSNGDAVTTLLRPTKNECEQKNMASEKAAPVLTEHSSATLAIPAFGTSFEMFSRLERYNTLNI